jgi:hypothetical protein
MDAAVAAAVLAELALVPVAATDEAVAQVAALALVVASA